MFSKLALVAVVAFSQVSVLSTMIVLDSLPYMLGETIRLKVMPVDPRDMFRGDYSILSYDFTRGDQRQIVGHNKANGRYLAPGQDVYVKLAKDEASGVWTTQEVTIYRPTSGMYLRGSLPYGSRVECGIEAYFVQEGEGRKIDEAVRGGRSVEAEVAVWRGHAKLKNVIVK
jgi:uncharacterized membrane-anchored protein